MATTKKENKKLTPYQEEVLKAAKQIKAKIEETPIDEREGIFNQIDKLEKEALTAKLGDKVTFEEKNAQGDTDTCGAIINGFNFCFVSSLSTKLQSV